MVLEQIAALIGALHFGTIEIVVRDGRVVQIQRKEKFRFEGDSPQPRAGGRGDRDPDRDR